MTHSLIDSSDTGRGFQKPTVSAAACPNYDLDSMRQAVRQLLAPLGGMGAFVHPGQRVLVKPNLLSARPPDDAVTTHPALIQAVVEAVQQAGGFPVLGDSPGDTANVARLREAYAITGWAEVAARTGTPLNLDMTAVEWLNPEGRQLRQVTVWKAVPEADVIINLPKLKTHNLTALTGAVKNCFGLIPSPHKVGMHVRWPRPDAFSEMLLDLYYRARPALNIMDAVVGMEGDGPSAGKPRHIGALLASTDGLACDVAMAGLVGCQPSLVTTIAAGTRRGLTSGRVADLKWVGVPLHELQAQRFRPGSAWLANNPLTLGILGLAGRFAAPRPEMNGNCIGCGVCADNCPAEAIAIVDGRAVVDRNRCIRCYCCQELCPEQAVAVRRPGLVDKIVQRITR